MKLSHKKAIALSLCTAILLQSSLFAEEKKESESLGEIDIVSTDLKITEGTGSYTTPSMGTSTKLDLSIRQTPQSISVITSQELQDKGITSYQSLLSHVTGVSLDRVDERLKTSARGFDIDYFKVDGIPTYETWNGRDLDLSMFDRIEIVRGANGLTTGAGNPGISINLIRKKATSKELTGNIKVTGGSWNHYGLNADIGSKLNEDGSIRGRLVIKHEDEDSYMDGYERTNNLVYGMLEADLTDTTLVSMGASYNKLDKTGTRWGGLPAFDSNNNLMNYDRSTIVSEDWTYLKTEEKMFFIDLEQILYNDINLNLSYSHNELNRKDAFLYFLGQPNPSDGSGVKYYDWKADKTNIQNNVDLNVNIPFNIGKLEQQLVLGASYNKDDVDKYLGNSGGGTVTDFYNYNISEPSSVLKVYQKPSKTVQTSVYLSGKFSLTEYLKLITGARLSSWETSSENPNVETKKFNNELTPFIGLVYDLDDNHSVYTSYTSIFNPQDEKDKYGNYLDPIVGKSYEAGVKGEYFEGDLNTSFSVFKIEQDGVAVDSGEAQINNPTADAYIGADGVTSKGFELDINGRISEQINLGFGFSNFKAENADGTKFNTKASRTTANAFIKYKLTKELSLGGGLQYKSKFYTDVEKVGKRITQKAYTLVNAMASYNINKNTNLQLNVTNLFDKKYYEGIDYDGIVYGEPRKFTLALKYSF